ncbi:MAG TPA: modulator protein, partial [Burkholderiaceae bacterium]|nr:modulator protein [Burkholderiaceae bacterium]
MSSTTSNAKLPLISSLRELEGLPDRQRRLLLRAGLGLSMGGSALLAACGGGDDSSDTSSSTDGTQNPTTANTVSSFALAVLPDTQFYSRYATTDE